MSSRVTLALGKRTPVSGRDTWAPSQLGPVCSSCSAAGTLAHRWASQERGTGSRTPPPACLPPSPPGPSGCCPLIVYIPSSSVFINPLST